MKLLLMQAWALVTGFLLAILVVEYEVFDIASPMSKVVFSVLFFALLGASRFGIPRLQEGRE